MMKRKIILISAVLIFLAAPSAFAQKSQEKDDMSLFEIDRLIRRTEYDEALRQLNIYIEKNPEKFEKHPSDQNLRFIADLKKSAEFNYFRALFLEIQNETAELSAKGEYVAAVEKAKEGFWLYRDDFYEQQEDNPQITDEVNRILAELDQRIAEFEEKSYLTRLNNSVNDFIRAVRAEQYDQAVSRFADVEENFRNYSRLRKGIIDAGEGLQTQFVEVQRLDADQTDASFLPFMFRFVFGVDSVPFSGILGAVDSQWNDAAGKMNEAVYSVLLKKYGAYETAISRQLK